MNFDTFLKLFQNFFTDTIYDDIDELFYKTSKQPTEIINEIFKFNYQIKRKKSCRAINYTFQKELQPSIQI